MLKITFIKRNFHPNRFISNRYIYYIYGVTPLHENMFSLTNILSKRTLKMYFLIKSGRINVLCKKL